MTDVICDAGAGVADVYKTIQAGSPMWSSKYADVATRGHNSLKCHRATERTLSGSEDVRAFVSHRFHV